MMNTDRIQFTRNYFQTVVVRIVCDSLPLFPVSVLVSRVNRLTLRVVSRRIYLCVPEYLGCVVLVKSYENVHIRETKVFCVEGLRVLVFTVRKVSVPWTLHYNRSDRSEWRRNKDRDVGSVTRVTGTSEAPVTIGGRVL